MSPNPAILTWPRPVAAGGGAVDFLHSAAWVGGKVTTFTFTDVPLGDEATDRYIVVHCQSRDFAILGCTINGEAATAIVSAHGPDGSANRGSLYWLQVSSGTSATVVVTQLIATARMQIGVHSLSGYGALSLAGYGSGTSVSCTIPNTTAGDLIVGGAGILEDADATWTGLTKTYDIGPNTSMSASGGNSVASGTSHDLSVAWSASTIYIGPIVGAAFTPA